MYTIPVHAAISEIDGKGVFTQEGIPADKIVWIYKEGYDIKLTTEEFEALPEPIRLAMDKTSYLSPWSGFWISPPLDDPACFTNHSKDNNNLSVVFDDKVSSEPYFIANRNIAAGEELTNNYYEFDKITQDTKPEWA